MNRLLSLLFFALFATSVAAGQARLADTAGVSAGNGPALAYFLGDGRLPASGIASPPNTAPPLLAPVALPRMAPELALQTYERRAALQAAQLAAYSSITRIRAQLPDTSQAGEYELRRHYAAPRSLEFKAVQFTGDSFVKSNVITRLLQSEVEHVQKDDGSLTAITSGNYKFSYKGTGEVGGHAAHVYQVKPRKKRVGLFKGRIYLDIYTGSLIQAEGRVVKSPSFFIKKIEFVQQYADVGWFTFPVHIHSEAQTRLIGRAVVDIYQTDYRPVSTTAQAGVQIPAL